MVEAVITVPFSGFYLVSYIKSPHDTFLFSVIIRRHGDKIHNIRPRLYTPINKTWCSACAV